jgi:uncharacterized membrane protein YedE/YeeE
VTGSRRANGTAAFLGIVFGLAIAWVGAADPEAIHRMLLLQDARLYLMMGSAVAVAFVGLRLLARRRARAVFSGAQVRLATERPQSRHVVGSVLFGLGWALSDACPGPIAVQLGGGLVWSLATGAGVGLGVYAFLRLQERSRQRLQASGEPAPASG